MNQTHHDYGARGCNLMIMTTRSQKNIFELLVSTINVLLYKSERSLKCCFFATFHLGLLTFSYSLLGSPDMTYYTFNKPYKKVNKLFSKQLQLISETLV